MDIDAELQRFLLRTQREIHVELVITMDSGEVESFNAYRVQHNNFRGPYKGGYRLAPDVDMQEMRRYQQEHVFCCCLQYSQLQTHHRKHMGTAKSPSASCHRIKTGSIQKA